MRIANVSFGCSFCSGVVFVAGFLCASAGFASDKKTEAHLLQHGSQKIVEPLVPQISYQGDANSLSFLMLGDYGEGNADQKSVAALLEKVCQLANPSAIFGLGDNIYPKGVRSADDSQWKAKFEDIYSAACTKSKPWIAVLGNHDYVGNPGGEVDYARKNKQWVMPARTYVVHYGPLLDIFAADSNVESKCAAPDCGFGELQKQATVSSAAWKIVLAHHPLFSVGEHKEPPNGLAEKLIPLYCAAKMDFFFVGHDHNLQHNQGKFLNSSCEINEFVVGGGGAQLYPVEPAPGITRFAQKEFGFALVKFEKTTATFSYYSVKNGMQPVYTVVVKKP